MHSEVGEEELVGKTQQRSWKKNRAFIRERNRAGGGTIKWGPKQ
jgi:hypothetical protein